MLSCHQLDSVWFSFFRSADDFFPSVSVVIVSDIDQLSMKRDDDR
jgi:hypothetical protein